MFADSRSHHADRSRTGNQHVFTQQVVLQGGVHRIAERVEQGSHVQVYACGVLPYIGHGQCQVFGEGAGSVDSDTTGVGAQVAPSGHAVATAAAHHMPFSGYDLPRVKIVDV